MVNLDNISFVQDSHGKKAVILSLQTYEKIKGQLEELEDIKAYIKVKSENQETFPLAIVEKLLLSTQSKIKTLREYRGYNVIQLANKINISEAYLSQIENAKRKGGIELYKKIADALNVEVDLLI